MHWAQVKSYQKLYKIKLTKKENSRNQWWTRSIKKDLLMLSMACWSRVGTKMIVQRTVKRPLTFLMRFAGHVLMTNRTKQAFCSEIQAKNFNWTLWNKPRSLLMSPTSNYCFNRAPKSFNAGEVDSCHEDASFDPKKFSSVRILSFLKSLQVWSQF